jgi:hypothetical protein
VKEHRKDLSGFRAESKRLGDEGLQAMTRIAEKIVGGDSGGQILMRSILLSLFGAKVKLSLSEVCRFDTQMRSDLCAVILGLNHGDFDDFKIREVLKVAGDTDAKWFFEGLPQNTEEDVF